MMAREIGSGEPLVQGCKLAAGFYEECDVVVVGSGSGGAVVAKHLSEAGRRVIVLEEGRYVAPEQYSKLRPTEVMRRMWREAGLLAAFGVGQTPVIGIAVGKCVGGSSPLTGGVCFRIPTGVHQVWEKELGLADLSEERLCGAYEDVERQIEVSEVPMDLRSYATRRLVAGAESLGIPMRSLRRNVAGCRGNARCNHGCPILAKRSVDIAYLPRALAAGARVVSDALVERVIISGGRATGVEGRLVRTADGRSHKFVVRAPVVVLACGTLHTPLVLMQSGVTDSAALGNHVTLHPAVRMTAQFDEPVDGFSGAMQSIYSDHFSDQGLTIVGVHPVPNVLAAGLPGVGASHRELMRKMRGLGVVGGMVHDEGGGRVRRGPGREPILWYRMAPRDLTRVRRLMTILGEIAFASGARSVFPPVFGVPGINSVDELHRLEHAPLDARRIECMAFHPLGSARMSLDSRAGVVKDTGETHQVKGLYVADGAALPTSIGVNSQLPIMAMATRIAWIIRELPKQTSKPRLSLGGLWSRARWQLTA